MKRYVCYVGTQGLSDPDADVYFQKTKVEVSVQWNSAADNSVLIFIKSPHRDSTEILGLPD